MAIALKQSKIKKLLLSEYRLHPEAQIRDYYKLFFQDAFGPAHILNNRISAENYLKSELTEASNFEEHDLQDIRCLNNYFRVNIKLIVNGKISFKKFLDLFIKSQKLDSRIAWDQWQIIWDQIEQTIISLNIPFKKEDLLEMRRISKTKEIISHSKIYKKNYHPHYRLIKKNLIENLMGI